MLQCLEMTKKVTATIISHSLPYFILISLILIYFIFETNSLYLEINSSQVAGQNATGILLFFPLPIFL